MNGNFEVEEYKKPEYEVRVAPVKARILQGEGAQATIDARYYFGEPVSGAKVKYAVYRSRYYFPLWSDGESEATIPRPIPMAAATTATSRSSIARARSMPKASSRSIFRPRCRDHKNDYRYRIEARVTDAAKREIVGRNSVIATYGSFLIDARPDRYFYQPNSSAAITVEARDYDAKPVRTRIHAELFRWTWRQRGAPQQSETIAATDVETGADGKGVAQFTIPSQGGSYRVKISAHTPEGRDIEDFTYLWVAGAGEPDYGEGSRRTVQMIPDKKSYQAGETAKVLIVTGKANTPVLVSIEGRDLRSHSHSALARRHRDSRSAGDRAGRARHLGRRAVRAQRRAVHRASSSSRRRRSAISSTSTWRPTGRSTGPARRRSTPCRSRAPTASPRRARSFRWAWWTRPSTRSAAT